MRRKVSAFFSSVISQVLKVFKGEVDSGEEFFARRPSIPPLVVIALTLWAALLLSSALFNEQLKGIDGALVILAAIALALLGVVVCLMLFRQRSLLFYYLVLGLVLGCALGCAHELSVRHDEEILAHVEDGQAEFEAISDSSPSDYGGTCLARLKLASGESICVRLLTQGDEILCGQSFVSGFVVSETKEAVAARYRSQGVIGTLKLTTGIEQCSTNFIIDPLVEFRRQAIECFSIYEGDGAALAKAILFGLRTDLSTTSSEFYDDVKVLGLAHLIAVSGSHLVIVMGMLEGFLRLVRVPRRLRILIALLFMLIYVVLTGLPVSAIRSAIMCAITSLSPLMKRRGSSLSSLSLCVVVMLCLDPSNATSLSLQLSAAATFGIVLFVSLFRSWMPQGRSSFAEGIYDGFAMTVAATLVTVPITVPIFSQLSLISPLANILSAPIFTILCCLGLIATLLTLLIPPLVSSLLTPIVWLGEAFSQGCSVLAQVPYAAIPVTGDGLFFVFLGGVVVVLLWVFWPQGRFKVKHAVAASGLCALLLVLQFVSSSTHGDEVIMLDVGQGDSFLIRSQGQTCLVDTGCSDSQLLQDLADLGIIRLDAILITHPDADHCKSLSALRGVVQVEKILLAKDGLSCSCDNCTDLRENAGRVASQGMEGLSVGDHFRIGAFDAHIIGPDAYEDEGGNGDSLCFILTRQRSDQGEWRALFCGDAEAEFLQRYLEKGRIPPVDLLKVPHHGARAGLTEELIAALTPQLALISVGADNSYGHPTAEVLRLLNDVASTVIRSDLQGSVHCHFSDDRIEVFPEKIS